MLTGALSISLLFLLGALFKKEWQVALRLSICTDLQYCTFMYKKHGVPIFSVLFHAPWRILRISNVLIYYIEEMNITYII